jgi:hypothetical protein
MQDFAPFIPELLGALSGPQTPGHKGLGASDFAEYYFKNNILILTEYSNLFRQLHPFTFDQKNNTLLNLKQTCILGYAVSLTFLFL